MRLAVAVAAAVLGWWEVPAGAQEAGRVRETAEVSLVEVPVRVLDRQGRPVEGLTAADFTLTDDGQRQEILGFDVIDVAEKMAPDAAPLPPAARRRFLTCVVEELSRGVPFPEALRRETLWSEDALLADWRRWAGI